MDLDLLHNLKNKLRGRIDLFHTLNSCICWSSLQLGSGNCVLTKGKGTM